LLAFSLTYLIKILTIEKIERWIVDKSWRNLKNLNIFEKLDHRSIHDDVYSARIHRYVVFINYEFEIINFMLEKKTFLEIREKIVRSQTFQHFSNMLYVWFSILKENQDVIQIDHAKIVY
jgi:hypothetical protein